jgi:hypothetical protein
MALVTCCQIIDMDSQLLPLADFLGRLLQWIVTNNQLLRKREKKFKEYLTVRSYRMQDVIVNKIGYFQYFRVFLDVHC